MSLNSFGIVKCLGCGKKLIVSFRGDQRMVTCRGCGVRNSLKTYTFSKRRLTPDMAKKWPILLETSDNLDTLRKQIPEYRSYIGTSMPFWCYTSHSPGNLARAGDPGMPARGEALGNGKVGADPALVGNKRDAKARDDLGRKSQEVPPRNGAAVQESASRDKRTRGVMRERGAPDGDQSGLSGGERKSVATSVPPPQANKGEDKQHVPNGSKRMGQDRRG